MIPVAADPSRSPPLHPQLHPWAVANPIRDAAALDRRSFAWDLLSKITFVAIAAICAAVLAVSVIFGSATGTLPFVLLGLVFVTPVLSIAASKLQGWAKAIAMTGEAERAVAEQFKRIKNWQEPQIREFLERHAVTPLLQIPPRALLPLIARFETLRIQADAAKLKSDEMMQAADIPKPDREHRIINRSIGWQILEGEAVPAALDAALILQILSQPTLQIRISDLGSLKQKSLEERLADRQYGPDDDFLVFHETERSPLTLREIAVDLSPQALRAKLFPLPAIFSAGVA